VADFRNLAGGAEPPCGREAAFQKILSGHLNLPRRRIFSLVFSTPYGKRPALNVKEH
jgi:hypothetical protein